MGQFSWKTQDTNKSIWSTPGHRFPVIMTDNEGNQYFENDYEGYGEFGGKDYYELVAEMNPELVGSFDRFAGITITFDEKLNEKGLVVYPALTESGEYYDGTQPDSCPNQGWYNDE